MGPPMSDEERAQFEVNARALYNVPDDYEGTALEWLRSNTMRAIENISALFMRAEAEDKARREAELLNG